MKRMVSIASAVLALGLTAACTQGNDSNAENADKYPQKPITLLSGFSPGSAGDVYAHELAAQLTKNAGWTVSVKSVPGASGSVAMQQLLSRPADGYTLLTGTGEVGLNAAEYNIDLSKFEFIGTLGERPTALAVKADGPYQNLDSFIAAAKQSPGSISIGVNGVINSNTLAMYEFTKAAGIELKWVPYEGGSENVSALLGGEIDVSAAAAANYLPGVASGDLKMLALTSAGEYSLVPDVPSLKAEGYDVVYMWPYSVFMRAGADPAVVTKLAEAAHDVQKLPEWADFTESQGLESVWRDGADTQAFAKAQNDTAHDVIEPLKALFR
jgi:tripartite-type tricarboxylate transporter receptor subunit TctC